MAKLFDVNRLTIRLALQKLNTLGITETRIREGTFVVDFSTVEYMEQASDFLFIILNPLVNLSIKKLANIFFITNNNIIPKLKVMNG